MRVALESDLGLSVADSEASKVRMADYLDQMEVRAEACLDQILAARVACSEH